MHVLYKHQRGEATSSLTSSCATRCIQHQLEHCNAQEPGRFHSGPIVFIAILGCEQKKPGALKTPANSALTLKNSCSHVKIFSQIQLWQWIGPLPVNTSARGCAMRSGRGCAMRGCQCSLCEFAESPERENRKTRKRKEEERKGKERKETKN